MNRKGNLDRAITILKGAQQAARPAHPAQNAAAKTKLTDTTLYVAFNAKGIGGIQHLLDSNTKRLVGVTNFDGNQLSAGRDVIIDGVRMFVTTTGTLPENADWQLTKNFDPVLLNSEVHLKQKDGSLIDMPVTDLTGFKNDDFRDISSTPLLKALETIELELETPKGQSVSNANDIFVRIEFRVTQAKR